VSRVVPGTGAPAVGPPAGLPRLLRTTEGGYAGHQARYGALPDVGKRASRAAFLDEVERSALRGRGGAGFPTDRKLRAVAAGRNPVVVANGAEGEPASRKDRVLLATNPHLVLDGAAVAARAVGASEVHVGVDRGDAAGLEAVQRAIAEREAEGERSPSFRVVVVPSRYVAGEESALVHLVNGGEAKPTFVPPRPYEKGVRGRPTLVQNVETLANLALIARYGADWYRSVGTPDEPGSVLVTVSGGVAAPGVYEAALGTPLRRLLEVAGGTPEPLSAVLLGGYFGGWLPATSIDDVALTHASLRAAGASLGSGIVLALPGRCCGVLESARIIRYLADESAGQCGPCVHGLAAVAGAYEALAGGRAVKSTQSDLVRWLGDIEHRGACHLPDAAVGFLRSALRVFDSELELHATRRRCRGTDRSPFVPLPDAATRDRSWR
jgi:NADH:ubiquinone oxidoreductase subunit F (NADH-binding)